MLRSVLSSTILALAAVSSVAVGPVAVLAQTPAMSASPAPAASGGIQDAAPVCGTYVPPFAFPDKDYTTSNGEDFKAIYDALAEDLATAATGFTETIIGHEVKGTKTQDRVYHFGYICPSVPGTANGHPIEARIQIISGHGYLANPGAAALWHGGTKIRGHQGGFISHLQIIAEITDPRATSLLGRTINESVFQNGINVLKTMGPSKLLPDASISVKTEVGPPEMHDCKVIEQTFDDPTKNHGITRERDYLDAGTYFLVRHEGYIGDQMVETEDFSKIHPSTTMTRDDFQ